MVASPRRLLTGIMAAAGLISSAGAVFAASCCVLPLLLGGLGAGAGLFSTLEFLADYRRALFIISVCFVVAAWVTFFITRPARSIVAVLTVATLLVGIAANWDVLERPLLRAMRANR